MALSGNTVWECRTSGSDTNGGGFVTGSGGTDYSQQAAAQYSAADLTVDATVNTKVTSASHSFVAADVGNIMAISAGAGFTTGWYQIVSVASGAATLDRSPAAVGTSGGTYAVGGALASPGQASALLTVEGMRGWVKAGTYNVSVGSSNVSNGYVTATSSVDTILEGYDVARGDRTGNRPSLVWTAASPGANTYIFNGAGGARHHFANLQANGNSVAKVSGFGTSGNLDSFADCAAIHCNGSGCIGYSGGGSGDSFTRCQASDCATGFSGGYCAACNATSCPTGFNVLVAVNCLSQGGSATNPVGFACASGNGLPLVRCTADACKTGFNLTNGATLIGCVASNCSAAGAVGFACNSFAVLLWCAGYNNTAHVSGTPVVNEGPFASSGTLTSLGADPYVSQATGDLRPNANSPGGAQLRGAGIGVFGQADNADIGAVQHTDPSGGGGVSVPPPPIRGNSYQFIG